MSSPSVERSRLNIRLLAPTDAEAYQALRLSGLQECPSAFASSYTEEASLALDTVAQRVTPSGSGGILGAFSDDLLVGVVGVHREPFLKLSHKATVWGMLVAAKARRAGIGRALLEEALAFAARLGTRQVNLGVNANNASAIRLYERVGFQQFGLERDFMFLDGSPQDEIHMACRLRR